jgi:hypothetical protein
MSQYGALPDVTFTISENLSAKQYFFMKIGTTDKSALLQDTAGGNCIGILQDDPDNSKVTVGRVRVLGPSKVKCGGTCTRGGFGTSDAAGKAVDATGAEKDAPVLFLESGAADDVIECVIVHSKTA